MNVFFFLCIFLRSAPVINDLTVDFAATDIYLHLYKDRVEVRTSSGSSSDSNLLGKYDSPTDGKIYLHLGAKLDPEYKSTLLYWPNIKAGESTVDVDITIENLNKSITFPLYVKPYKTTSYNTTITFHVESADSLEFESYYKGADLTVLTTSDDVLIKHILPITQRSKYVICYNSLQCSQRDDISIQPEDNYIASVTDTQLPGIVKTIIADSNIENIKIYFIEPTETANLTSLPFKQIETIELIGFTKETPQKVHFDDNSLTNLAQNWTIQNVQFSASNTATLNFNNVFIKDTEKVFLEGPKFCLNTAHEIRNSESKNSPLLGVSEINISIFEISPSFDHNGDLTVLSKSDIITITNSADQEIATIPLTNSKETRLLIQNAKNANKNKVYIKANNANRAFNFYIEDSDKIPFEFSEWNDNKYSNFLFTFYTGKLDDISVIYDSSQLFQYKHFNFEKTRLFNEFPILENKFIFCLSSTTCDHPEFDGPDILPIPVSGSSLSEVTTNFHTKLNDIEKIDVVYFYVFLNKEDEGIEIDLSPYLKGENLEKVGFINVENSGLLNISIKSLPKKEGNNWEINKCNLLLNSLITSYKINELLSIDNGRFTGEQIEIKSTKYLENIDLTVADQTILISSNSFSYLDNIVRDSDTMKLIVKTGNSNPTHNLIFKHQDFATETCNVEIDVQSFDEENKNIPIQIPENWHEIPTDKIGKIQINVLSNEHVTFRSLTDKVNVKVLTKEENPRILAQIPANCSQEKVVICLESDQCSSQSTFTLNDDEIYLSTQSKDEFEQMMNVIFMNQDKFYKFVRFSMIGRSNQDYEIPFQKVPNDKFEQLQLYGYQIGYDNAYIALNDDVETEHIKKWLIYKVCFRQSNDNTKTHKFDDFTIDGGSTSIFYSSNNAHINTAHFICKKDYYVTGLTGLTNKVDRIVYEIDYLSDKDYVISLRASTIALDGSLTVGYQGNPTISSPVSQNLYFHIIGPSLNDHKLYVKRYDSYTTFTKINLIIDEFDKVLPVRLECEGSEVSKNFEYNFFTTKDGFFELDNGTCKTFSVNSTLYPSLPSPSQSKTPSESPSMSPLETPTNSPLETPSNSPLETPSNSPLETPFPSNSPSQSPVPLKTPVPEEPPTTIVSDSKVFEMVEVGYVDNKNETQEVDNETHKITAINFNQENIEIKESSVFQSNQPLYFIAEKEGSTITINENVAESNIGIYSDNNPTIVIQKEETPLSFMNRHSEGGNITINVKDDTIETLKFNELNNQKGQFLLNVPSSINSISLTTLIMQYYSQLKIKRNNNNKNNGQSKFTLLDEIEEEYANLIVLDNFTISPQSFVTVNNLILNGSLFINTDSSIVVEDRLEFSKNSSIEILIKDPKVYQNNLPIFNVGKNIVNKPSKIIFVPDNYDINVSLIRDENMKCEDLIDLMFVRKDGHDFPLENSRCDSSSGEVVLSFYATPKEKKGKLSTGGIVGIVVACVVVVVIIVLVAILLVKRKKSQLIEDQDEAEGDEESIGL